MAKNVKFASLKDQCDDKCRAVSQLISISCHSSLECSMYYHADQLPELCGKFCCSKLYPSVYKDPPQRLSAFLAKSYVAFSSFWLKLGL